MAARFSAVTNEYIRPTILVDSSGNDSGTATNPLIVSQTGSAASSGSAAERCFW